MKRILFDILMLALAVLPLRAQDNNVLKHASLSAGISTTGITADAGTMLTDYVSIRAGVEFMPGFKYSTHLKLTQVNQTKDVDVEKLPESSRRVKVQGTLHNSTCHALLDIYPSRESKFHLSVGAYLAIKDKVVTVVNTESELLKQVADLNARRGAYAAVPLSYGQVAAKMGDYNIMPDDEGNASAFIKVKRVRPYVGVGFGRAVPGKSGMNCQVDLGVQLWGKPHVYNGVNGEELIAERARGEDGGYLKTISRISFYPVLTVRFAGKIF